MEGPGGGPGRPISRLRPGSKSWDFYTGEDIENGWIVFTGVQSLTVRRMGAKYCGTVITVRILATGNHLEDPGRPGVELTE